MLWTTKNEKISSTNNLVFQCKPSEKSLISIRNKKGPRIEPWATPTAQKMKFPIKDFSSKCDQSVHWEQMD